jgi:hypothetical protein
MTTPAKAASVALAVVLLAVTLPAAAMIAAAPCRAAADDDPLELARQTTALSEQTIELEGRLQDKLAIAFAVGPYEESAADALPLLAGAQGILGQMTENIQSSAALWAKVAALDLNREATTYAEQQYHALGTYASYNATTGDLLEKYAVLYDADKRDALSANELRTLEQEIADLEARNEKLLARLMREDKESLRYFNDHDVDLGAGGGVAWMPWLIRLGIASASAVACGVVAGRKNRNVALWGVFGFFVPLVAVITVLVVRKVELERPTSALLPPPS